MSRTIIVSRTLKTLSIGDQRSSSQVYEVQLATALSEFRLTTVISLAASEDTHFGGIELVALRSRPRGFRAALKLAAAIFRRRPRGVQIIAFGYDPLMVLTLIISRALGAAVYTVVFDSHVASTEQFTPAKRILANIYFGIGKQLLRVLSGIFVVTKDAERIYARLNRNVLKTAIGLNRGQGAQWSPPATEGFNVIYAGALEVYNGVQEMLDGVIRRNMQDHSMRPVVLNIYGTGSLRPIVESYAAKYDTIRHHGVAAKAIVDEAILDANLALNLRDLKHPVSVSAFPSKLIELFGLGVPVMSTAVLPSAVLSRYALLVAELSAENVREALEYAEENYETVVRKALLARTFVAAEYDWQVIVTGMLDFMIGDSAEAV